MRQRPPEVRFLALERLEQRVTPSSLTTLLAPVTQFIGSPMVQAGGINYFLGTSPATGRELFRTDGTPAGTSLVADINPGPNTSVPNNLTASNGVLYFSAANIGDTGLYPPPPGHTTFDIELYRSDGTTPGTHQVEQLSTLPFGSSPGGLFDSNGILLFTPQYVGIFNNGLLYRTDGTVPGTGPLDAAHDVRDASNFFNFNGSTYFDGFEGGADVNLFRTNGTAASTVLLQTFPFTIQDLTAFASPGNFTAAGGQMFFTASTGTTGVELWRTDATVAGTYLVKDIYPGQAPGYPTMSINDANSSFPHNLTAIGNRVFFVANNGANGNQLWVSNGTTAGTSLVKVINPAGTDPPYMIPFDGVLYFLANDGVNGMQLWSSDGTAGGTSMVTDINPGGGLIGVTRPLAFNNHLYFFASDGTHGTQLWVSDGTGVGTGMISAINTSGGGLQQVTGLNTVGNLLVFGAADSASSATVPHFSTGLPGGTSALSSSVGSNPSGFANAAVFGNTVYYDAFDSNGQMNLYAVHPPLIYSAGAGAQLTLRQAGASLEILDGMSNVLASAPEAGLGAVVVDGSAGNVTLTVDYATGGYFNTSVQYNGGSGDKLAIAGDSADAVVYQVSGAGSNVPPGSGAVTTGTSTVTFTGLSQVDVSNAPSVTVDASQRFFDSVSFSNPGPGLSSVSLNANSGAGSAPPSPPLVFQNVPALTLNLVSALLNPFISQDNSVLVSPPLAAAGLANVTVDTGAGNDAFYFTPGTEALPVPGGAFTLDGGAGSNNLNWIGNSNVTLSNSSMVTPLGTIDLANIQNVNLAEGGANNTIDASGFSAGPVSISATDGDNIIHAGQAGDTILLGSGNNLVDGGGGTEKITTGAGINQLTGGTGNTTFYPGLGTNTIVGGPGTNTVVASGTDITLTNTSLTGPGTDSLTNIQAVILGGTGLLDASAYNAGALTLTASGSALVLPPLTGGTLIATAPTVTLQSQADGDYTLTDTSLTTSQGVDSLTGFVRARITGGGSSNTIDATGFSGDTTLSGGGGADHLLGGTGNNTFLVTSGNETINGGPGPGLNTLIAAANSNFTLTDSSLVSTLGTDVLSAIQNSQIACGPSNDQIDASTFSGTTTLDASAGGNDTLLGGAGAGTFIAGPGQDVIHGGGSSGDNTVVARGNASFTLTNSTLTGPGTATMTNIQHADLTATGPANSTLDASAFTAGAVTLTGGPGNDLLVVNDSGGNSLIGGPGSDTVCVQGDTNFTLTDTSLTTNLGIDTLSSIEAAKLIDTGTADHKLDATAFDAGPVTLTAGAGDDTLLGGAGDDTLVIGTGNDSLDGGGGVNTVVANAIGVTFHITATTLTGLGIDSLRNIQKALLNGGLTTIDTSAPLVLSTTMSATGVLPLHATSLQVHFDRDVLNADQLANYTLQGMGPDALLGTPDDVMVPLLGVMYAGDTATLTFDELPQSIYRLAVSDAITSLASVPLDGNYSGQAGSNFTIDFLSSPATNAPLSGPGGKVFDPQLSGFGAGQLVQGTNNAFDGLNRLQVDGVDYAPIGPTDPGVTVDSLQFAPGGGIGTFSPILDRPFTLAQSREVQAWGQFTVTTMNMGISFIDMRVLLDGHIMSEQDMVPIGGFQVFPITLDQTLSAGSHDLSVEVRLNDFFTMVQGGTGQLVSFVPGTSSQGVGNQDFPGSATGAGTTYASSPATVVSGSFTSNDTRVFHFTADQTFSTDAPSASFFWQFKVDGQFTGGFGEDFSSPSFPVQDSTLNWYQVLGPGPHTFTLLSYISANTGSGTDIATVHMASYDPVQLPTFSNGGRTLVTPMEVMSGLNVHREVTVPVAGSQDFARTVDYFENPTGDPITTTVRVVGNLGSDLATRVFDTSNDDTVVSVNDEWIGTDGGPGTPALVHILHGPLGLAPASVDLVGDNIEWTYNLLVPANQTVELGTFTVQANTETHAVAEADALLTPTDLGGQADAFLTLPDLAALANFQFPPTPKYLAFDTQPTDTTAGATISPPVTVLVEDRLGNLVTSDASYVTLAIGANPAGGTLSGTATLQAVSGVAIFSTLSIDKVGAGYTLAAYDGSLHSATSSAFAIIPGTGSQLAFAQQPTDTTAGATIAPAVTVLVEDSFGNVDTNDNSDVTVALEHNPAGGTLSGTLTVMAQSGVATFTDLSLDKVGTGYILSAADSSLTPALSQGFNITAGTASQLAFGVQPGTTSAGHTIAPAVTVLVEDSLGNLETSDSSSVSLSLGANPGGSTLSGTTTVSASSGVATFSTLSLDKIGTGYTLAAGDGSLSGTKSGPFAIVAGAATQLSVDAMPSSVVAGSGFLITVRAEDALGNFAAGYNGTVHFTSTDPNVPTPAANAPIMSGIGFAVGTLTTATTAGPWTVTAHTITLPTLSGTSGPITVDPSVATHFVVSAPPAAVTGIPFNVTVTAEDQYNNVATGYTGLVSLRSSDTAAVIPPFLFFSPLDAGVKTFSATLNTPGDQTISVADLLNPSINGQSGLIATRGLMVTSFTPEPYGFVVAFNKAYDPSTLNLYDGGSPTLLPPDLTVIGDHAGIFASPGPLTGSLLLDQVNHTITWVCTFGLLPDDTYHITLVSGSSAFQDLVGVPLDGNNSGMPGANYTTTMATTYNATSVGLSVASFARGPAQNVDLVVPLTAPSTYGGIPIQLSDGNHAISAAFTLTYDTALLTVTGAVPDIGTTRYADAPAGSTFTRTAHLLNGSIATDVFAFSTNGNGNLGTGNRPVTLGELTAVIPNDPGQMIYGAKQILHLTGVTVTGTRPGVAVDGFQLLAFLGDSSGDAAFAGNDGALTGRVSGGQDSGFAAFPLVDPILVADVAGDGIVDANDASQILEKSNGYFIPTIPDIPAGAEVGSAGPDPTLSLPAGLAVGPDGILTVPVNLDDPHPAGSTGLTEARLALRFDPSVFTVSAADVHLGSIPSSGTAWTLSTALDPATGQLAVTLYSLTPIAAAKGGSLVTIDFHERVAALPGVTAIQLVPAVALPGGSIYRTAVADEHGAMVLGQSPAESTLAQLAMTTTGGLLVENVTSAQVESSRASDTARSETGRLPIASAVAQAFTAPTEVDADSDAQATRAGPATPSDAIAPTRNMPAAAQTPGLGFQGDSATAASLVSAALSDQRRADWQLLPLTRPTARLADLAFGDSGLAAFLDQTLGGPTPPRLPSADPSPGQPTDRAHVDGLCLLELGAPWIPDGQPPALSLATHPTSVPQADALPQPAALMTCEDDYEEGEVT
jgi:ELWxxDGT repeat protein